MASQICCKCHCEFSHELKVCPWCGTSCQPPTLLTRLRWPVRIFTVIVIISSFGIVLTWPLLWDILFQLGLQRPLQNYSRLEQLLEAGEWRQADQETARLIEQSTQSQSWDGYTASLASQQVKGLPCTDLQMLNSLWLKYSNGRFGFSVQKQIYEQILGRLSNPSQTPQVAKIMPQATQRGENSGKSVLQKMFNDLDAAFGGTEAQREFRREIGWDRYQSTSQPAINPQSQLSFSLAAPAGHLPTYGVFLSSSTTAKPTVFSTDAFANRQEQCGL